MSMTADQPWLHHYPLADGRRIVVIERDDGMAVLYWERPAKRRVRKPCWVRDRTERTLLLGSFDEAYAVVSSPLTPPAREEEE